MKLQKPIKIDGKIYTHGPVRIHGISVVDPFNIKQKELNDIFKSESFKKEFIRAWDAGECKKYLSPETIAENEKINRQERLAQHRKLKNAQIQNVDAESRETTQGTSGKHLLPDCDRPRDGRRDENPVQIKCETAPLERDSNSQTDGISCETIKSIEAFNEKAEETQASRFEAMPSSESDAVRSSEPHLFFGLETTARAKSAGATAPHAFVKRPREGDQNSISTSETDNRVNPNETDNQNVGGRKNSNRGDRMAKTSSGNHQAFYDVNPILSHEATYNVIFGERSNGKTYAALKYAIQRFVENREQFAYVRRWQEDVSASRAKVLFNAIVANGTLYSLTNGEFTDVHYWTGKWYLCTRDEKGKAIYNENDVLGYAFSLTASEHQKSTSYPKITTIVFDEFLTNKSYLPDEFVAFMNVVSTIVRRRSNVKVLMLGNTVNKFCPYFQEMGLTHVKNMEQGKIDVYSYGDSKLKVAVEYCKSSSSNKESNKYFAFDNPKLEMITGGAWELAMYPHLPMKYNPTDVIFTYFIVFNGLTFQCEIITKDEITFTYIHQKTTPIKNPNEDIIFSDEYNPRLNYCRNIFKGSLKIHQRIAWFFKNDKVFYQNNDVGDTISNYLKECNR